MDNGTILTFYSYKGGVGRTLTLANVAAALAKWGYHVLCVDWDLEAPGLSHYFQQWINVPSFGLVDLIEQVAADATPDLQRATTTVPLPGLEGRLALIPAGTQDQDYVSRVQRIDWSDLYENHDLGAILERMRIDWTSQFDFVLVDSRTGITDIGGICTVQLPDTLVILFTANHQSLEGAIEIARRSMKARNHLPYDRSRLLVLPIPSRIDAREEYDRAVEWQRTFVETLRPFYADWAVKETTAEQLLERTTIPYFARWSFGEELPIIAETVRGPDSMSFYLETVAAIVAHRLARSDLLIESRDSYVDTARRVGLRGGQFKYDALISSSEANERLASELAYRLRSSSLNVFLQEGETEPGAGSLSEIDSNLAQSRHLVVIVEEDMSRWQRRQAEQFIRQTVAEDSERSVFPILAAGASPKTLPSLLQRTHYFETREESIASIAADIAVAIGYDVFVSYPWEDRAAVLPLAQALRDHGLRVFVDDPETEDFTRITTTITKSLAASKVLLAYYSAAFPTRRACQWELTAAYLAAQRDGDPSHRILVLNPEPTLDHLHPGELRDALFRRLPADGDQAALAELARAVAQRVRELPGPLSEVAPLVPARWLPTQGLGSPRFVGRLPEMWRLHSALHTDTTRLTVGRTGPAVAQLRGLGGIGKTLLAEEYALRFGAAYPGGVFWLRAYGSHETDRPTTPAELAADHDRQVRAIAARLGLPVADRSPDEVLGALAAELERRGERCLWVVDDLPDGLQTPQVQALLAPHPLASTLVTTRSRRYDQLAAVVDLDVLPPQDALALLLRHRPAASDQDQADAAGLVADLGYHALAVDVAGAALHTQTGLVSVGEFRAALQDPSQDELELAGDLAKALHGGHQASIAATLERSIRRLDPAGSDVLRLASVLAAAPLPLSLIAAVLQEADGLDEQAARRQGSRGVAQAEGASLASPTRLGADPDAGGEPTGEGGWVVHALVAQTIRFIDPDQPRTAALRTAAVAVLTEALAAIVDPRAHTSLRQAVPHARELARHPETTTEVDLLAWVGRYDHERGDYRPAEQAYRQVLDARRRLLGPEHPATLTSMNNLALTLLALGDAAGAAELHRQVLEAYERVLGPEHPNTLTSINNLALTLQALGDAAGAADLHRQALEARRRLLGPEHPDTLTSMNNLAATLYTLGDAAGAADLLRQALDAYRRLLGPDNPNTRTAAGNLASVQRTLDQSAP